MRSSRRLPRPERTESLSYAGQALSARRVIFANQGTFRVGDSHECWVWAHMLQVERWP